MAVSSARIVSLKQKGHFENENESPRFDKYTLADRLPSQLAALDLRPRSMPTEHSYSIRKLTAKDKGPVLKFLRRFFFRDEPMNQAVNLLETPESRCQELEDYATLSLDDGVSLAAVDINGEFVGLIINGIARREEADYTDKSEECPNPKFRKILRVLSHLDREAKIWEKLPKSCHTVVEVRIASTHSDWRGRGLMRVLCEEAERLASSIGAGAMRMDATSSFSAAAASRLHYKQVYGISYAEMSGAPQPKSPHLEAKVFIKELQ